MSIPPGLPPLPVPPIDDGATPPATVHGTPITVGDSPKLGDAGKKELPDDFDAIETLENEIKTMTGKDLKSLGDALKVEGSLEKDGDKIKVFTFRNGNGPESYYFKRVFRVTYNGQTKEFTKNIYTNVEVPRNHDLHEHQQKVYMASIAATMYGEIIEETVKTDAGQAAGALYNQVHTHISKIKRDRFVTMELFAGDKPVPVHPQMRMFSKKTKPHEKLYLINNVRILKRTGDKDSKDEASDSMVVLVKLAEKTSRVFRDNKPLKPSESAYHELFNQRFVLQKSTVASSFVNEMAKIENFQLAQDTHSANPSAFFDQLSDAEINPQTYAAWLVKKNEALEKGASKTYQLLHGGREQIESLSYKQGGPPFSDKLIKMLPKGHKRVSDAFKKPFAERYPGIQRAAELTKDKKIPEEVRKEAVQLIGLYRKEYEVLKGVVEEENKNDEDLQMVLVKEEDVKAAQDRIARRNNYLAEIDNALNGAHISAAPAPAPAPATAPAPAHVDYSAVDPAVLHMGAPPGGPALPSPARLVTTAATGKPPVTVAKDYGLLPLGLGEDDDDDAPPPPPDDGGGLPDLSIDGARGAPGDYGALPAAPGDPGYVALPAGVGAPAGAHITAAMARAKPPATPPARPGAGPDPLEAAARAKRPATPPARPAAGAAVGAADADDVDDVEHDALPLAPDDDDNFVPPPPPAQT